MPDRRLPNDKRDRIVELFNTTTLTNKEIADDVGTSERTVYTYRKRYKSTGVAVNPRQGRAPNSGNYKLFPVHDEAMLELSERKGDLYLDELRDFLRDRYDLAISVSALSKWIQRQEWSQKKAARITARRDETLRAPYRATLQGFSPAMLVFVEETGLGRRSSSGDKRTHGPTGWAPAQSSQSLRRSFCFNKASFAVLPAITARGMLDYMLLPGGAGAGTEENATTMAPTTTNFWIANFVLPKMKPYPAECSVLVMEPDPTRKLVELCQAAGVKLVSRPPYSADLNPIELFFVDLDRRLRKNETADGEGMDSTMLALMLRQEVEKLSSPDQFQSYFRRVGVSNDSTRVSPESGPLDSQDLIMHDEPTLNNSA